MWGVERTGYSVADIVSQAYQEHPFADAWTQQRAPRRRGEGAGNRLIWGQIGTEYKQNRR